jgi:hypothetical protein
MRFDKNLPQAENSQQNTEYDRTQKRTGHKRRSRKSEMKSLVLCGVIIVRSYEVLWLQ